MGHISERGAVDVSVDGATAKKLGMIECIECLEAEFQGLRLADLRNLVQRDIEVVHARPIKHPAGRVPLCTNSVRTEERGVEGACGSCKNS